MGLKLHSPLAKPITFPNKEIGGPGAGGLYGISDEQHSSGFASDVR
jgi:hypothetical protein